jgi:hypothetical protein
MMANGGNILRRNGKIDRFAGLNDFAPNWNLLFLEFPQFHGGAGVFHVVILMGGDTLFEQINGS